MLCLQNCWDILEKITKNRIKNVWQITLHQLQNQYAKFKIHLNQFSFSFQGSYIQVLGMFLANIYTKNRTPLEASGAAAKTQILQWNMGTAKQFYSNPWPKPSFLIKTSTLTNTPEYPVTFSGCCIRNLTFNLKENAIHWMCNFCKQL